MPFKRNNPGCPCCDTELYSVNKRREIIDTLTANNELQWYGHVTPNKSSGGFSSHAQAFGAKRFYAPRTIDNGDGTYGLNLLWSEEMITSSIKTDSSMHVTDWTAIYTLNYDVIHSTDRYAIMCVDVSEQDDLVVFTRVKHVSPDSSWDSTQVYSCDLDGASILLLSDKSASDGYWHHAGNVHLNTETQNAYFQEQKITTDAYGAKTIEARWLEYPLASIYSGSATTFRSSSRYPDNCTTLDREHNVIYGRQAEDATFGLDVIRINLTGTPSTDVIFSGKHNSDSRYSEYGVTACWSDLKQKVALCTYAGRYHYGLPTPAAPAGVFIVDWSSGYPWSKSNDDLLIAWWEIAGIMSSPFADAAGYTLGRGLERYGIESKQTTNMCDVGQYSLL